MSFYNNDATASNNTALNGIDIQGTANVSNFDNGLRELAAQTKQFLQDLGGANTVGGSADAITISPAAADTVSAAFDGMMIGFEAASDNTSAVTANVGSIGAEPVKKAVDGVETTLAAGDIQAGGLYVLRWRAGWDSGNGAWQLLGLGDALPASEDARGAVELATVAEAQARTDTARAVTPAGLAGFARFATGTYTGDGTTSQAITGLGFQPRFVAIFVEGSDGTNARTFWTSDTFVTTDAQGLAALLGAGALANELLDNRIVSLDNDGFTLSDDGSDADPNSNGKTYHFIAWG